MRNCWASKSPWLIVTLTSGLAALKAATRACADLVLAAEAHRRQGALRGAAPRARRRPLRTPRNLLRLRSRRRHRHSRPPGPRDTTSASARTLILIRTSSGGRGEAAMPGVGTRASFAEKRFSAREPLPRRDRCTRERRPGPDGRTCELSRPPRARGLRGYGAAMAHPRVEDIWGPSGRRTRGASSGRRGSTATCSTGVGRRTSSGGCSRPACSAATAAASTSRSRTGPDGRGARARARPGEPGPARAQGPVRLAGPAARPARAPARAPRDGRLGEAGVGRGDGARRRAAPASCSTPRDRSRTRSTPAAS